MTDDLAPMRHTVNTLTSDALDALYTSLEHAEATLDRVRALHDDQQHQCPGIGEIQLSRILGRGLVVDHAPARSRMALHVLADRGWGARLQGVDLVNIAEQVLYRITGWDAESGNLLIDLVEDWRTKPSKEQPGA